MAIPSLTVDDEALEETRSVNATIEALLASSPPVHTVEPAETRRARLEGRSWMGPIVVLDEGRDEAIAGPGGDIPLRVFAPPTARGVYLHLHGGGWTLGAANQQDVLLSRIAREAGVAVVSVDYRLAPEHPFPAGPDDCEAAAVWLVEHGPEEWGPVPLVIGGESAGAHLAALTLLRIRDRHGLGSAFAGANLVFGCFDLGMTPSQRRWGDRNLVLSSPIIRWFSDTFLPGRSLEERRDPAISPLWADLGGLPPALFTVGDNDPLLDDSLFMAARWEAAGGEAELVVYPESIHGFAALPTQLGRMAVASEIDFIRRRVDR